MSGRGEAFGTTPRKSCESKEEVAQGTLLEQEIRIRGVEPYFIF